MGSYARLGGGWHREAAPVHYGNIFEYLSLWSEVQFLNVQNSKNIQETSQIIVADAADAVSVNFSGRCKFLQI